MALLNRVKAVVSTAPGTGTYFTMGSADPGYRSFSSAGAVDGATYSYAAEEDIKWEYGFGVWDATNNRISRLSVVSSAGDGVKENFGAGAKVFVDALDEDFNGIGDVFYSVRTSVPRCVRADGSSYVSSAYPLAAPLFPEVPGTLSGSATAFTSVASAWKVRALAVGNSTYHYVGVGGNGFCMVGSSSAPTTISFGYMGISANFNGVAHNSGKFIAVGDGGLIYTSTNGLDWTQVTSPVTTKLNTIHYATNASRWIVAGDGGVVLKSADNGLTWTVETSGTTNNLLGIVSNATDIVICGLAGQIVYSNNYGGSWTAATALGGNLDLLTVANVSSSAIYYGTNSGEIYQATFAAPATTASRASGTTSPLISSITMSSTVVFGRADGQLTTGSTSSWTTQATPLSAPIKALANFGVSDALAATETGSFLDATAYNSWTSRLLWSNLVVRDAAKNSTGMVILIEQNLVLFAAAATPNDFNVVYRATSPMVVNRVAATPSGLVICGGYVTTGPLLITSDGTTWTNRSSLLSGYFPSTEIITSVNYADGKLVLGGSAGRFIYTSDFTGFTVSGSGSLAVAGLISGIAYAEHIQKWSMVTSNGYSHLRNRSNLTNAGYSVTLTFNRLVYGNKMLVATQSTDTDSYWSVDGLTWTLGGSLAAAVGHMTYSAGIFVVAGGPSVVRCSYDGKTWSGFSVPTTSSTVLADPENTRFLVFTNNSNNGFTQYFQSFSLASPAQFKVPTIPSIGDNIYSYVRVL